MKRNRKFILSAICSAICMSILAPHSVQAANSAFDKGIASYQKRDYQGALSQFAGALKAGIQPANAMYYQALCWQNLGRVDNAKIVYSEIVRLYPSTAAAQQSLVALNVLDPKGPVTAGTAAATAAPEGPTKLDPKDWYMGYKVISEVPFYFDREGMIVNVIIDGKSVPAIWDTGATGMHFNKSQLISRGVDISKSHDAGQAIGIGGSVKSYEFDANVTIGRETCRIPVAYVNDDADVRNGADNSKFGLVGEEFFGKYVYEVDPTAHKIRFLKKTSFDLWRQRHDPRPNQFAAFGEPFQWEDGHIHVTSKVNGRECEMIFDTGATTIAFTDKQLNAIGMTRPVESGSGTSSGVGGSRESFFFNVGSLELGPASSKNIQVSVLVHGIHPAPLLGQSFLQQMRYIIDPEHRIIRIGQP